MRALGELTGQGTDTFEYDVESGLTEAVVGGSTNRYEYNGDRVRMAKSVDLNRTEYTVDVLAELPVLLEDGTYKYVYGLDLIAAVDSSDDALYHLNDGLGSTVSVVGDDGVERQYMTYDAFGAVRTQVGGEIDEFLFAGEQFDSETGLVFLRARYYDPATGRLLSRDPQPGDSSVPATLNPYAYVGNNPATFVDPSGEVWWPLHRDVGPVGLSVAPWTTIEQSPCAGLIERVYFLLFDPNDPMSALPIGGVGSTAGPSRWPVSRLQALLAARGGALARGGVRFAQRGVSSTFRHGEFAGRTIDDVAAGLRSGVISPSQLPIQSITRDGVTYTLNNRSLMALRQAGKEPTRLIDVTGNPAFEKELTRRLRGLGSQVGPDFVPRVRGGN